MRYLISKEFSNEFLARKKYIYDSIKLWTILMPFKGDFITLESMPLKSIDIFFIVGHNSTIKNYLELHYTKITEKTIVAITCDGNINFTAFKSPEKTLFIPHQNKQNYADLLDGSKFGFNFNLTESEIIFYNIRNEFNDVESRIELAFTKL